MRRRLVRARRRGAPSSAKAAGSTSPTGSRATSGTAPPPPRCSCGRSPPVGEGPEPAPHVERPATCGRIGERRGRPRRRRPDRDRRPPRRRRRAGADPGRRREAPCGDAAERAAAGAARLRLGRARRVRDRRRRPHRVPVPPCRGPRPSLRRGRRRAPRRAWVAAARRTSSGGRPRSSSRARSSSCALRFARCSPSSGGPIATGPHSRLPAETVERCRTVLREVGLVPGEVAAARVDLEASPTYRAACEQVEHSLRLSPRPGGLGEKELQHPSTNMWVWQRCRAAPKPSGTTLFWPSCSAGSRTTTRTLTPTSSGQRSTTPASITAASAERAARSSSTIPSPSRRSAPS